MTTKTISFALTPKTIMVIIDGRPRSFPLDTDQGQKLRAAAQRVPQDIEEIKTLADVASYITQATFGRVVVDNRDQIRLDGKVVDYGMTGIIMKLFREGSPVERLTNFLVKVSENPNKGIADDLYQFISNGSLPIEPDGDFLAFKRVSTSYMDLHSNSVNYALGEKPSMDRALCDDNRNNTCSRGLHACSYDYLPNFHSNRGPIMIVKINPRDITAIPTDYNLTKLRCCLMEVIGEVPEAEAKAYFSTPRTSDPVAPVASAPNTDGVLDLQESEIVTLEQVQDEAYEDGQACGENGNEPDMAWGNYYDARIGDFSITYPIHFARGYVEKYDLEEYHSEKAYGAGMLDAEENFKAGSYTVERAFDYTEGSEYHNIPQEHEPAYIYGYMVQMLLRQSETHPDK